MKAKMYDVYDPNVTVRVIRESNKPPRMQIPFAEIKEGDRVLPRDASFDDCREFDLLVALEDAHRNTDASKRYDGWLFYGDDCADHYPEEFGAELVMTGAVAERQDRFRRVAESRMNRLISDFAALGKCADKRVYDYSDEDVRKIIDRLRTEVDRIQMRFDGTARFSL